MQTNTNANFQPNWASAPGDTIAEILNDRNLSLQMFATKMDSSTLHVKDLLHGYISINDEIAQKLQNVLGASSEFWLNRENKYRDSLNRLYSAEQDKWIRELPVKDMIKFGWLAKAKNTLQDYLAYFNVPDTITWNRKYSDVISATAFRISSAYKAHPASIAAWLRQGEIQAQSIRCNAWNKEEFKERLSSIRTLTKRKSPKNFLPELVKHCAECGVAVVVVQTPAGCSASGAAKFITDSQAMIILSFRYKTDDHFWFTFFHEAGHLILHGHKTLFIEDDKQDQEGNEEQEANNFSKDVLIPRDYQSYLYQMRTDKRSLMDLANDLDISLGILVGQLQHIGRMDYSKGYGYKRKYSWEEILTFNH